MLKSLKAKLLIIMIGVSALTLSVLGVVCYNLASNALRESQSSSLEAAGALKESELKSYCEYMGKQLLVSAEDVSFIDAMKEFNKGYKAYISELSIDAGKIAEYKKSLYTYYSGEFASEYNK